MKVLIEIKESYEEKIIDCIDYTIKNNLIIIHTEKKDIIYKYDDLNKIEITK